MVRLLELENSRDCLPPPLQLLIGKHSHRAGGGFERPFDDFLGRSTYTAGERRFQQFLPVR
jgi:hypothetical protein